MILARRKKLTQRMHTRRLKSPKKKCDSDQNVENRKMEQISKYFFSTQCPLRLPLRAPPIDSRSLIVC